MSLLICGVSVPISHAAGQVITQEAREWAKKTLENEKKHAVTPDKNTMVILYFQNLTGRKELTPLEKGMTLMLLTDLSQVPDLQLIERIKLQALAEELKLGSSGLVDKKTAPRIGKLVGAGMVVGGDFSGKKKTFDTKSRILNVASSKISGQFSLPGTYEDILETEKELVFKIVDQLKITLKPKVEAAIRKPCSTNLKALDALFRGVDASDRGELQQAGEFYNEALKADPDVCVAATALQELVQMNKYSDRTTPIRMKGKTVTPAKAEMAKTETAKAAEPMVEAFAPQSALADAASSVSGQTSLTNQFATRNTNNRDILPRALTPVTIRVNFP
jgi:TolB-like protein